MMFDISRRHCTLSSSALTLFGVLAAVILLLTACSPSKPTPVEREATQAAASKITLGKTTVILDFQRLSQMASNQFAVWIEDSQGRFVKTIYATNFTARGGYKKRPQSLPEWRAAAKWEAAAQIDIDAVSKATPSSGSLSIAWDCTDKAGVPVAPGVYVIRVEGNNYYEKMVFGRGEITVGSKENNIDIPLELRPTDQSASETTIKSAKVSFAPVLPSNP